ncbi:MAG: hypothetical protein ABH886_11065 [Candidatus Desantisbacteria bacterium]
MVHSNNNKYGSYVPLISIGREEATFDHFRELNEKYLQPMIDSFLQDKEISSNSKQIEIEESISDLDFKSLNFDYFYEFIFDDIKKENGKIVHTVKYAITFDKALDGKTININDVPVFYWIYIDFAEMMQFLRVNCHKNLVGGNIGGYYDK